VPENFLQDQGEQEPARGPDGRFGKGHSGNPAGRPAGRRNNATLISEAMFDAEAATLTRTAIDLALDGNATALRLCLQRLLAPRRERPVGFALPPIENAGDIVAAMAAVTAAVADGTLSPSDAYALSQTVDTFLRAIDARDFEARLRKLEEPDAARRE
jgi:hypothetical protein